MNFSNYRFTLDLHSLHSQTSIPVMLGDTGITWHINLCDGGKPYLIADGCLAKISIKRPTGTYLEAFCEIRENTTIVYPFEQDTCASVGLHNCEITLYGINGAVLGTPRFSMVVGDRVLNNDDINITDQDRTIVDAMVVEEAKRQVAEESRVARFEETIENMNSQFEETVGSMNSQFDETVGNITSQFNETHENITSQFNETHENITSRFDETVVNMNAQFDRTVEDMGEQVDKFVEDMKEEYKNPTIHIGPEAPENDETIWIDTDEEESAEIDVVAKVGQVIAVKSVDAKGKPVDYKAVDLPKVPTPNWNANEGEGFIEGRTHYVDKNGVVHKLDNKYIDADWMATKEDGGAGKTVFIPGQTVNSGMWNGLQEALVVGNKYAVDVKGILYECVCRSYDGTLYVGNGLLMDEGVSVQSNEPFCIAWMGGTATGGLFYSDGTLEAPIGIEVRDWQDTIHNQLPEEYLPDCAVKGDKNGVLSWSKLSDKPFVEGAGELFLSHTATFATDAAAKNGVRVADSISNPLGWLEVNGELLKGNWKPVGMMAVWYDADGNKWVTNSFAGVYVFAQTAGTYAYKFYTSTDELMLDPKHIPPNIAKKSDIPEGGGGANIDVVASVGQTIVVEKVDADGKPTKWKAADYQERTHWEKGTKDVETLAEVAFTGRLDSSIGAYAYTAFRMFTLKEGHQYKVIFDGVEYSGLEARVATLGGITAVAVGNFSMVGGGGADIPFVAVNMTNGYAGFLLFDGNEHTAQIFEIVEDVQKVPTKFVPTLEEMRILGAKETDIVPLTTFKTFLEPWTGLCRAELPPFELEEGRTYTVIFDGTTYTCETFIVNINRGELSGIGIGCPLYSSPEEELNDMPFTIFFLNNSLCWVLLASDEEGNEHTVRVIGEKNIYHKIPKRYLEQSAFAVEIEQTDDGYTLWTPWEDIISAANAKKNIYGIVHGTKFEYDEYDNLRGIANYSRYLICMTMDVSLFTSECEMVFWNLINGIVQLTITRDENGVTTITTMGN